MTGLDEIHRVVVIAARINGLLSVDPHRSFGAGRALEQVAKRWGERLCQNASIVGSGESHVCSELNKHSCTSPRSATQRRKARSFMRNAREHAKARALCGGRKAVLDPAREADARDAREPILRTH
ncbi:MAG TPA: hypothetical protein VJZ00_07860 [Thermoanaerobaculia bacterium]|nr:hypothetical protein [Thermoanaerobaculia bacterium]